MPLTSILSPEGTGIGLALLNAKNKKLLQYNACLNIKLLLINKTGCLTG